MASTTLGSSQCKYLIFLHALTMALWLFSSVPHCSRDEANQSQGFALVFVSFDGPPARHDLRRLAVTSHGGVQLIQISSLALFDLSSI